MSADEPEGVLLGEGLAKNIGAKVGDTIVLMTSTAKGAMNASDVRVRGLFTTTSKAYDDGALRTTVAWLYRLDGEDGRAAIVRIGEAWAPYRTCASLYLWNGLALRRSEGWEPPK